MPLRVVGVNDNPDTLQLGDQLLTSIKQRGLGVVAVVHGNTVVARWLSRARVSAARLSRTQMRGCRDSVDRFMPSRAGGCVFVAPSIARVAPSVARSDQPYRVTASMRSRGISPIGAPK
jgi:hypothetical protein